MSCSAMHTSAGESFRDDQHTFEPTPLRANRNQNGMLTRTQSAQNFSTFTQMERNYCKLGDQGFKQKDFPLNGRIKVASLDKLNIEEFKNGLDSDSEFAGRRDVTDPSSLKEKKITSNRGSVRGFKNRVRAGIATFKEESNGNCDNDVDGMKRNYRQEEKGKVIVYTTSMTVVRKAADKCKAVKNMLQTHMVRYEERDLFMSDENQKELMERLGYDVVEVPHVFVDGVHIGSYEKVQEKNETGELRDMFKNFPKIQLRSSCDKCGGHRFLPCSFCHGSKKSYHRNNFTEEFCALRCMQCDENGLIRCDLCIDQQE